MAMILVSWESIFNLDRRSFVCLKVSVRFLDTLSIWPSHDLLATISMYLFISKRTSHRISGRNELPFRKARAKLHPHLMAPWRRKPHLRWTKPAQPRRAAQNSSQEPFRSRVRRATPPPT